MAHSEKIKLTDVSIQENLKVTYKSKRWSIFTWYVQASSKSIGRDLIITTKEKYDRVFINGQLIK